MATSTEQMYIGGTILIGLFIYAIVTIGIHLFLEYISK